MQKPVDQKRTAIAVLLSIFVILAYQRLVLDKRRIEQQAIQQQQQMQPAISGGAQSAPATAATGAVTQGTAPIQPTVVGENAAVPSRDELAAAQKIIIDTSTRRIIINRLGGRLQSCQLKDYKLHEKGDELYDIVQSVEGAPLPLGILVDNQSDVQVRYALEGAPAEGDVQYTVADGAELELKLSGQLPSGKQIVKTFHVGPSAYLLAVTGQVSGDNNSKSPLWLEWSSFVPEKDTKGRYNLKHFTLLGLDNKIKNVQTTALTEPMAEYGANTWASFGDTYFMEAVVPTAQGGAATRIGREGDLFKLRVAGDAKQAGFVIYTGPKEHSQLKQLGLQLERSVDLGWFSFIAHPLLGALKFFHSLLGNWGLAIILLTLSVKTLFLPLTQASFKSMKAMQDLQPELKALRERIQDPTQLNQETLALYKKRGVNPAGGCFPMMIQIPVFFGLYNALLNAIELRHAPFALWITDLSSPERLEIFGIGVPIMILIMGASMIMQQVTTPSAMDPAQKRAMLMMPVIFTGMFIVFPMPAGLVLYWLVNNLISITQQVYLRGDRTASPLQATILADIAIFAVGFILTLI